MWRRFIGGWSNCGTLFDYAAKQAETAKIDEQMAADGFWSNQERAQAVVAQRKSLNAIVKPMEELLRTDQELATLVEMGREDEGFIPELRSELERAEPALADLELKSLAQRPARRQRGDPLDQRPRRRHRRQRLGRNAAADVYALGPEARLLGRAVWIGRTMARRAFKALRSSIRGPMAYGYLKGETGMHRLVRISPFNAEGKRQTSFAAVDVSPEIAEAAEIEIRDEDIREDVFRASGAGGQHVNKTSSAIRLTHLPTNIVVQCQNERSQHKNRATAYKMLRARLARLEEEKREAAQAAKYKGQAKTGFGSQIRNYFLHPDQRVKDQRTGYYMGNFQSVLDGNIQGFLDAYLALARDRRPRRTARKPGPTRINSPRERSPPFCRRPTPAAILSPRRPLATHD